ncbi:MAG: arginine deiminase-related protein, partial [Phycisphaerales bacterium]|nr:arginine deiminase-related protein [Phycisphaerales bacterium]
MSRFLMCPPDYYGVEYEINPWMDVRRNAIREPARTQWDALANTLGSLPDVTVDVIAPQPGLPDMVFAANAGIVTGNRFIASRFRPPQRRGETPHYERWFAGRGYQTERLPEGVFFEGEGDVLRSGDTWFVGYYFRSDARAHDHLSGILGQETLPLRLIDPRYYHLDTCFHPLDEETAIVYPEAFDEYSRQVLYDWFPNVIAVSAEEAERFCCNAIVV